MEFLYFVYQLSILIGICQVFATNGLDPNKPPLAQINLQFKNATLYKEINATKDHPFGFFKGVIPYPPNDGRLNVVTSFVNLTGKYIKIWGEPIDQGATMCVQDNGAGPEICGAGAIVSCYAPSRDKLKFEFYCAESCLGQATDVSFWYRFKVSPAEADDQWCTNQVDHYPSDLRPIPSFIPQTKTTPPTRKTPNNSAKFLLANVLINIVAFTLLLVL